MALLCPLCGEGSNEPFHDDRRREFRRCRHCRLVFVPPAQRLDAAAERAEYDRHRNHPFDPAYRRFLERLAQPLCARLAPGAGGLDFGCGPGPALALMLRERGHPTLLYDPLYAPFESVWDQRFDFITATEVVEHLHAPGRELSRLWERLRPGGWLGVMTKRVLDRERFATWHYKNDPTHVCFFSVDTLRWLAAQWGARLEFVAADVVLLGKPAR